MGRLHGRLELVAADDAAIVAARRSSASASSISGVVPQRAFLLGQRHIVAVGVAPRGAARLGKQHQRQQAERLRLVRHQRGHQPAEPDAFVGEVAAPRLGAGRIGPAFGEGGVDRLQHGVQPLAELGALGHAERNAGLADAGLGAHQPLAHRRRRDQEGRGDRRRVEAEHGLQDQRRAHARFDRRMGAGEHQPQPLVGQVARRSCAPSISSAISCRWSRPASLVSRRRTASTRAAPRHRQQPGLRLFRHAAPRPAFERRGEGVGQRVLGAGHVARARREKGDQLAVALPGGGLGGRPRRSPGAVRTVTARHTFGHRPDRPHLHRAGAGARAARRPGQSRRRCPARRSCSSRRAAPWCRHRGRSSTLVLPPATRTVVAV